MSAPRPAGRLRVDPVACDGFGYCAELVPELITSDEWGYPLLSGDVVGEDLAEVVARAVASCPRRALFVERVSPVELRRRPVSRR